MPFNPKLSHGSLTCFQFQMSDPIPINLAFEDALHEAVLLKMLSQSGRNFYPAFRYSRSGFGYLKRTIKGFNNASVGIPFFVLTDLDKNECAPSLIRDWLPYPMCPNLLFRVAVHEVEAWILADRKAFSSFLGISEQMIPQNLDEQPDPKALLIRLVKKSKKRALQRDIVPRVGSGWIHGPNYNAPLIAFVAEQWDMYRARQHSESLSRAMDALLGFKPLPQTR